MRIAMITGWFLYKKSGSGASVFIQELKEGLEERGVEVDLITPQFLGINNYYLATLGRFFKNLLLFFRSLDQYDLIICFDYDGFAIRQKVRTPVVCCPRGIFRAIEDTERGISRLFVWFQGILEQRILSKADYVIANSVYAKKAIQHHYGVDGEKITVIYTGIDINKRLSSKLVRRSRKNDTVRFLAVGKMYPRKNFPFLVKVFDQVHQRLPNTELHLVGDGIEYNKVLSLREQLDSKNQIELYGFVSKPEKLKEIYVDADVVCHFSEQESFGNVVLEALALGKPVFALDQTSLPEQVQDGFNGLLFDTNDPEIIADKIVQQVAQPRELERLGKNAYESSKAFTKEKMIDNFYAAFQRFAGLVDA